MQSDKLSHPDNEWPANGHKLERFARLVAHIFRDLYMYRFTYGTDTKKRPTEKIAFINYRLCAVLYYID